MGRPTGAGQDPPFWNLFAHITYRLKAEKQRSMCKNVVLLLDGGTRRQASWGPLDRPTTVKAPEAAWDYAAGMISAQSNPTSTTCTGACPAVLPHGEGAGMRRGITVPPLLTQRKTGSGGDQAVKKHDDGCVKIVVVLLLLLLLVRATTTTTS
jgi:hypothetical protein